MTSVPPVIYRMNEYGLLTKRADDLAPLVMPRAKGAELLEILIDVLMEDEANRLFGVFSLSFGKRLDRGGRIIAGQVDEFAKLYENVEPEI